MSINSKLKYKGQGPNTVVGIQLLFSVASLTLNATNFYLLEVSAYADFCIVFICTVFLQRFFHSLIYDSQLSENTDSLKSVSPQHQLYILTVIAFGAVALSFTSSSSTKAAIVACMALCSIDAKRRWDFQADNNCYYAGTLLVCFVSVCFLAIALPANLILFLHCSLIVAACVGMPIWGIGNLHGVSDRLRSPLVTNISLNWVFSNSVVYVPYLLGEKEIVATVGLLRLFVAPAALVLQAIEQIRYRSIESLVEHESGGNVADRKYLVFVYQFLVTSSLLVAITTFKYNFLEGYTVDLEILIIYYAAVYLMPLKIVLVGEGRVYGYSGRSAFAAFLLGVFLMLMLVVIEGGLLGVVICLTIYEFSIVGWNTILRKRARTVYVA